MFIYGGSSFDPASSAEYVVRQHRIPDGLIRWEAKLDEMAVGKGVVTPEAIYIPCEEHLVEIVSGKDEKMYFGKISRSARWRVFGDDSATAEKQIGSSKRPSMPDESEEDIKKRQKILNHMLRGNLLLLPGRIISAGYYWTNCFKAPEEK